MRYQVQMSAGELEKVLIRLGSEAFILSFDLSDLESPSSPKDSVYHA